MSKRCVEKEIRLQLKPAIQKCKEAGATQRPCEKEDKRKI